ncbi:DUF2231 domain-containing protein [Saccharicrinis sp. FJH62]|uniref:DUF2231 domain-containing protein n=1 Tax=Saccharicrinis sp. FJH62 TaxID=3344657 RepID=UPI0035D4A7A3
MIDTTHLHPMIVHFPIALLIVGFVFDIVSLFFKKEFFSRAGFTLLILGALGTVAALLSGELAGSGIAEEGMLKQALEIHESAAELTIWLVSITALYRIVVVYLKKYSGILKVLSMVLFFASVLAIARTGYYGGELVFKHAAGVELNLGF